MENPLTTEKVMTFGEELVGLTFNPSGSVKVQRAKELCAELANLLNESYHNPYSGGDVESAVAPGFEDPLYEVLFQHAIGEILNAQMNVVKVLTFKK